MDTHYTFANAALTMKLRLFRDSVHNLTGVLTNNAKDQMQMMSAIREHMSKLASKFKCAAQRMLQNSEEPLQKRLKDAKNEL